MSKHGMDYQINLMWKKDLHNPDSWLWVLCLTRDKLGIPWGNIILLCWFHCVFLQQVFWAMLSETTISKKGFQFFSKNQTKNKSRFKLFLMLTSYTIKIYFQGGVTLSTKLMLNILTCSHALENYVFMLII